MTTGHSTKSTSGGGRRLTLPHLLVRLFVMLAALAALDAGINAYQHNSHRYDDDWRLPVTMPMAELPGYVDHIVGLPRDASRPVVLFLGASPTWGAMNSDSHHTYPAVFGRTARAAGVDARVYNLGADGALVSDDYFIADRLAGSADLMVVQLTYQTFNPAARIAGDLRFPELPRVLGEPVSGQVASTLGITRTRPFNLSGAVDRTLGRFWTLFREHDALAARLFGRPPQEELFARWQKLTRTAPRQLKAVAPPPVNVAFDDLEPSEQELIVHRYSDYSHFRISPADSEMRMLDLLCADLQRRHTRAVFFLSPLDREVLEGSGVLNRKQYDANAAAIRAVVERHGLTFIDWNQPGLALPSSAFADMTHTTDAGSALFARRLYARLAPLLRGGAAGGGAEAGGAAGGGAAASGAAGGGAAASGAAGGGAAASPAASPPGSTP
ncbi:MAG: hypothetical protein ABR941_08625 [Thermoleophilia bacterium]